MRSFLNFSRVVLCANIIGLNFLGLDFAAADVPVPGRGFQLHSTTTPENAEGDLETFATHLREFVSSSNYIELGKLRTSLLKGSPRFADGNSKLSAFYTILRQSCPKDDQDCKAFIEKWKRSDASDPAPLILEGRISLARAWAIRGGGVIREKSEDSMEGFEKAIEETAELLSKTHKLPNLDASFYCLAYEVAAIMQAPPRALDSIFEEGLSLDPLYTDLYINRANFLRPLWGAKPGLLEVFAEDSARRTKDSLGDGMYALIADGVRRRSGGKFFVDFHFSWPRIKSGFQELAKRYPTNMENASAYLKFAVDAEDKVAARAELARLGNAYDPRISQMSPQGYEALVVWANDKTPEKKFPLIEAVREGDTEKVSAILKKKVDVDAASADGSTALIVAVRYHPQFVPLLLEHKANPDAGSYYGHTALDYAVMNGDRQTALLLMKKKPDPAYAAVSAIEEDRLELLQDLLSYMDPNHALQEGSLLHVAIANNRLEAAKMLLADKRTKINNYNRGSSIPAVHLAAQQGKREFLELILKAGGDPNIAINGLGTAFDIARNSHPELLEVLSNQAKDRSVEVKIKEASAIPSDYRRVRGKGAEKADIAGDPIVRNRLDGKWKEIKAVHDQIAARKGEVPADSIGMNDFYGYLNFCPDVPEFCESQHEKWAAQEKDTAIPLTALLILHENSWMAADAKAKRSQSPEKSQAEMRAISEKAWALFQRAKGMADADVQTMAAGVFIAAMSQKSSVEMNSALSEGIRRDPSYWPLWCAATKYYLDANDVPGLARLADKAVEVTRDKYGDGFYARIAFFSLRTGSSSRYPSLQFSWDRVKKGFDDMAKANPDDKYPSLEYLMISTTLRDKEATRSALALLGNKYPPDFAEFSANPTEDFQSIVIWAKGDTIGKNELIEAVLQNNSTAVEKALSNGAQIDERNKDGDTALTIAVKKSPALVPLLLRKGATALVAARNEHDAMTMMIEKNQLENLKVLFETDFDPNQGAATGSPLAIAIKNKNLEAAKIILASTKLIPESMIVGTKSEYALAIETNQPEIVRLLAKHPNTKLNTWIGIKTVPLPIYEAVLSGKPEFVRILLEAGANPGLVAGNYESAFDLAKKRNDKAVLDTLLNFKGAAPKAETATASLSPMNPDDAPIAEAVRSGDEKLLSAALDAKYPPYDPNKRPSMMAQPAEPAPQLELSKGYTALHLAAKMKNARAVQKLVKLGEYANLLGFSNAQLESPLLIATKNADLDSVRLLLAAGASPLDRTDAGESPFLLAKGNNQKEIMELFNLTFEQQKIRVNEVGQMIMTPNNDQEKLNQWAKAENLSPIDMAKGKGIEKAIQKNDLDALRLQIEVSRMDPNPRFGPPTDPLPLSLAVAAKNLEVVKMLLAFGANPRMKRGTLETPMELALKGGDQNIISLLQQDVERKDLHVRPNVGDYDATKNVLSGNLPGLEKALKESPHFVRSSLGSSALHIAVKNKNYEAIKLLLQDDLYRDRRFLNESMGEVAPPLFLAALQNDTTAAQILIEAGASPESGPRGESTISYAQRTNKKEVLSVMEEALKKSGRVLKPDGTVTSNTP